MTTTLDIEEQPAERHNISVLRQKIGWICQLIRWLTVIWLLWWLYLLLTPLISVGPQQSATEWNTYWGLPPNSITVAEVYVNRCFALLSWATSAFVGYAIWQLMSGYLAGDILSAAAARRIRVVGLWGLAAVAIDIVIRPFMFGLMSTEILNKIAFMDWFSTHDLFYTVIALFVLSLGHIQGTAAAISDEHKQFV
jgi:hypothetical protein